jgi:pseudo-rSAM protein
LYLVNITGGNIFDYSRFSDLLKRLGTFPGRKKYHAIYADAVDNMDILSSIEEKDSQINLLVPLPVIESKFASAARFAGANPHTGFTFVIADARAMKECERIVTAFQLGNVSVKPYYNGKNLDFFKDVVFIDKQNILSANPSQKEILARMAVNVNDFGKLMVMSAGDIYANVNAPKIGNIEKQTIHESIYKELYRGKSWLKVRPHFAPCKGCLYNLLCPSLSNYEYILGRNNLCNIL